MDKMQNCGIKQENAEIAIFLHEKREGLRKFFMQYQFTS